MVDPVSLIARPLVNTVVSLTSKFIMEQYHLVYGVKNEVVKLESNLTAIQATLMEVEGILSDASSQRVQDWLIKLKDSALDVQDVLEIYAAKASKMNKKRLAAASPLLRREASLNIKKIAARINEISVERKNLHGVQATMPRIRKAVVERYYGLQQKGSSRDSSEIFGREEEKEKIVSWMLSKESEASVVTIIGMAGLGKTTLAQLVFNDGRAASHFDNRIWIDVTIRFNLEKIGKEIIEGVTEAEHPLNTWSSIVKRIDEVLNGKRFLLVLDGMWNERFTDWEKLWQLLKKGRRGSRVIITSRISEITKTVAAKHTLFLELLSEEACRSVFANIALSGDQSNSKIREIGEEIVQKCNGLPLAVTGMAILLRGCTDVNQWQRVVRDGIWGTELKNAANGDTNILPALRLSYDHLPSHLKQCFSYCCIFPKGHAFDRSDLVKLWMAQGFIDSGGQSLPEEIGSDYFEELRSRSFFYPANVNVDETQGYRMHDFLHDLATFVSGQSCQVVDNEILEVTKTCRHVSFFVSKDVQKPASKILEFTKLRTFLLPTNGNRNFGQALDKMFNKLEYLRVLDLSSSTPLIELPKSIEKLLLLRYLDLSRTEIRKLPSSVCKLVKLQTLKLLGCLWLSKLPKDLGNLTNLRHLQLDDMFWYKCSSLPPRIGNLTNLQNLHLLPVVRANGRGLEQLQKMKYLTGKLWISKLENATTAADANLKEKDRLKELVLEWSEVQTPPPDPTVEETIIEKLDPHSNIKGLQIRGYKGNQFPKWMANLTFQNLSTVSLSNCVNIRSLSCGLLSHVSELNIKEMLALEEWREAKYLSLKRLHLSKCPKLRSLPSSFQKLRIMKINSCDMLKNLPVTPSLKSLILIDNIVLETEQEEALSDIETSNPDGESASEILFSKLKIVNCPKLKDLRPTFKPQRLEISNCPLLKRLLVPEHSLNLEHVAIDRCSDGNLVEAVPSSSSVRSLLLSNIANLISLPVSLKLQGLKSLYIHECEDFTSLSDGGEPLLSFNSLKLLSVCDCPKLITFANSGLPTSLEHLSIKKCSNLDSLGLRKCLSALVALKDFYLEDCPKLKSFPEDGPPTSLKHLSILGCPLLSQRFNNEDPYRQMIAHITDLEIDST